MAAVTSEGSGQTLCDATRWCHIISLLFVLVYFRDDSEGSRGQDGPSSKVIPTRSYWLRDITFASEERNVKLHFSAVSVEIVW